MSEQSETLKKIANLMSGSRTNKIESWTDGLLLDAFDNEIFDDPYKNCKKTIKKLIRVHAKIQQIYISNPTIEKPEIITIVNKFLKNPLPHIGSGIVDYSQKEGRYQTIKRSEIDEKLQCLPDSIEQILKRVGEEQYFLIDNTAELLYAEEIAFLKKEIFPWTKQQNYTINLPTGSINIKNTIKKGADE